MTANRMRFGLFPSLEQTSLHALVSTNLGQCTPTLLNRTAAGTEYDVLHGFGALIDQRHLP